MSHAPSHIPRTDHTHSPLFTRPGLMTTVAPEEPSCGQKRKQPAIEDRPTAAPPAKKAKRRQQRQQGTNAAYLDSLSKLWLTQQALNELNRRNRHTARRAGTTLRPDRNEPIASEPSSSQLKRFARHGGPDLRNLRGVCVARP